MPQGNAMAGHVLVVVMVLLVLSSMLLLSSWATVKQNRLDRLDFQRVIHALSLH